MKHNRVLRAARRYTRRGWRVVPVPYKKKECLLLGWPTLRLHESGLRSHFSGKTNIGVLLGKPSGNLVDVDLDCREAVTLADQILPRSDMVYGRDSRPAAHRFYLVDPPPRSKQFLDTKGKCLLELRSTGLQTLVPPSVHPSGERLHWERKVEASRVDGKKLERAVTLLAAFTLLARNWPEKGSRQRAALALSGMLLRAGWTEEAVKHAISAVARATADKELKKREEAVKYTIKRLRRGREATGRPELAKLLGKKAVEQVCEWLRIASPPKTLTQGAQYWVEGRQICMARDDGSAVPLCNFNARVREEILLDNGVETTRALVVKGRLQSGEKLPTARVPATHFGAMNWILGHWGAKAIVAAGFSRRDQLREAIQRLSPNPKQRHVFTHTGWREINGHWVFITGSGAIGGEGVHVDLEPEVARYKLPLVPEKPPAAMRASLRLLDLAPLTVTVPLWAAMFRAPLGGALPSNLTVWTEGATGSYKTTLGALFLCHFGAFENTSLPGSWESTANQLEHRAFVLKDVPFLIDDYAPKPLLAFRELEAKAARLLRAQGNLSGRGRLRPDATERPAHPPRGLIISTGEQHPAGRSLLARCLLVHMKQETVDISALTKAQETAHLLPHAMSGFVAWLASQMPTLGDVLRKEFEQTRTRVGGSGHSRVPEVIAHLWLGVDLGLRYAVEVSACTREESEKLRANCWDALVRLANVQYVAIEAERPTLQFLRVLFTLLSQGRAVLHKRTLSRPPDPHEVLVGWYDADSICLIPEAAYREVARFQRDSGETFPLRQERLGRELFEEGLSERGKEHLTVQIKVGGRPRRVIRLYRQKVEELLGERLPYGVTSVTASASIWAAASKDEDREVDELMAEIDAGTFEKPVTPVTTPKQVIRFPREPMRFPRERKRFPREIVRFPRVAE
jgi:Bifunctional DNA primase/polymerase, N-terminal